MATQSLLLTTTTGLVVAKLCELCGREFAPKRVDARVCGPKCRKAFYHTSARMHKRNSRGLCAYIGCGAANVPEHVYCTEHARVANKRRKKFTLSYKLQVLDAYGGRRMRGLCRH